MSKKLPTISDVARKLILEGKTNTQVLMGLRAVFGNRIDKKKEYYPAWFRCQLRRAGKLPEYADFCDSDTPPEMVDYDEDEDSD